MQVGYPETGEFFGIALAVFPSPEQMAFEQTSPAVACVDIGMARPEDCPGCLGRDLQDVIIQDACSPDHSNRANSKALPKVSCFSLFLTIMQKELAGLFINIRSPEYGGRAVCLIATIAYFSRSIRAGQCDVKGISMKKMAMSALMAGALGLSSIAATAPADAHWRGWGPGPAGGLFAGAVIGGLASSAYGYGPGYGYYGYGPGYYRAGYYGRPNAYDYGYDEPYRWGGGYTRTTYYTQPVSYSYRYRRVVRPAYAYYRGAYPVARHRWHHHHW